MKNSLSISLLLFSFIWACCLPVFLDNTPFYKSFFYAFPTFIFSLIFFYLEYTQRKKRAEIVLQHALSKSTGTNILLSVTQAMELEPFMNHFTKINKHIQNSTNNLEGLSQYRLSEEMQRRRDQSLTQ